MASVVGRARLSGTRETAVVTLPRWEVRLGVVALSVSVVALVLVGATAMSRSFAPPSPATEPAGRVIRDDFGGSGPALGRTDTGQVWTEVHGAWATVAGEALVHRADGPLDSVAVVDLGHPDGFVRVTLNRIANGTGVIIRHRDAANYTAVVAAPDFGGWSVQQLVNGARRYLGSVGPAPTTAPATVEVRMRGTTVDVYVNGTYRDSVNVAGPSDATGVGLVASPVARWPGWGSFEAGDVEVAARGAIEDAVASRP